jgi:hypothetical protein
LDSIEPSKVEELRFQADWFPARADFGFRSMKHLFFFSGESAPLREAANRTLREEGCRCWLR